MTKAYDIEDAVFSGRFVKHMTAPAGLSVAEQQAIADQLVEAFDLNPVTVQRARGGGGAAYLLEDRIRVPSSAGVAYVCHEVAHLMCRVDDGHNDRWRNAYVLCVREVLSNYQGDRLEKAFCEVYPA